MDDITETLAPKSNQLDGIDLATSGPRIFTVASVDVKIGAEQPIAVHFEEFDRPWKPGVTMRRVLAKCWGKKSKAWTGNRVELYYEPEVTYGKEKPGGVRIRRISGIERRTDVPVLLSQGRPSTVSVDPLPDAAPAHTGPTDADIEVATDVAVLRSWWAAASRQQRKAIEARVRAIESQPAPTYADIPPTGDELGAMFGADDE